MTTESLFATTNSVTANVDVQFTSAGRNIISSNKQLNSLSPRKNHNSVLTFIEWPLIGTFDDRMDPDNTEPMQPNNSHYFNDSHNYIPTLHEVENSGNKQLDGKQCIAYEVICTTVLLWLVYGGTNTHASLGRYLQSTLNCTCSEKWDDIIKT